ncbi:MAG TPA: Type 1 glutamine amidotransferase-like domain-containing protein, partial [Casimicrobiaceae bacterium]
SQGVLLAGMSAGALCWFAHGVTDSHWGAGLQPMTCLGFLPGACCVHYNGDPTRRPALHAAMSNGIFESAIAIDDGAAVLFSSSGISRMVTWRPNAAAYCVTASAGELHELPLASEAIA